MRLWSHRFAAHRASGSTGGDHGGCFRAEIAGLLSGHATGERRVGIFLAVQVVGHDDDSVFVVIVSQFHSPNAELLSGLAVEVRQTGRFGEHGTGIGKPLEHLLERQSQCLHLLFFHPNRVRLAIDDRQKPEPAFARLTYGFDLDSLSVEISTHSFRPPVNGGNNEDNAGLWNPGIIA